MLLSSHLFPVYRCFSLIPHVLCFFFMLTHFSLQRRIRAEPCWLWQPYRTVWHGCEVICWADVVCVESLGGSTCYLMISRGSDLITADAGLLFPFAVNPADLFCNLCFSYKLAACNGFVSRDIRDLHVSLTVAKLHHSTFQNFGSCSKVKSWTVCCHIFYSVYFAALTSQVIGPTKPLKVSWKYVSGFSGISWSHHQHNLQCLLLVHDLFALRPPLCKCTFRPIYYKQSSFS